MASRPTTRSSMTLPEFLAWPRIDRRPYLEYVDGRIEVKRVSPQPTHSVLQDLINAALNGFARPGRLGASIIELRCTFGGRSIVPDVAYFLDKNIRVDARGRIAPDVSIPPDIHIEVRSPDQTPKKTREKIEHSLTHGCPLAWSFDPLRETVDVFRPGRPPERLPAGGVLDGGPVLPGFLCPVAGLFEGLIYRKPGEDTPKEPNP